MQKEATVPVLFKRLEKNFDKGEEILQQLCRLYPLYTVESLLLLKEQRSLRNHLLRLRQEYQLLSDTEPIAHRENKKPEP